MKRSYALYLTVAIVAVMLAASLFLAGCGAQATPTPTPTKTPKPTFTATPAAPTRTSTPYITNTPTPIPATATPLKPTGTPIPPTATPKPPTPTSPPAPPTNTPRPTTPPTPTSPPPPPYTGTLVECRTHGGSTSVVGTVYKKPPAGAGDVIDGVWIRWWADGWNGDWVQSGNTNDGAGAFHSAAFGNNRHVAGTWKVAVVAGQGSQDVQSNIVSFTTSNNGDPGACNDGVVNFQSNY